MKKIILFIGALFMASCMFTACGGNTDNAKGQDAQYEEYSADDELMEGGDDYTKDSGSVNCDEFIKGYERFIDQYVVILNKMANNPEDLSVMTDYSRIMTEASTWSEKSNDCADDPKYAARLMNLQTKLMNVAAQE